jgi:ABC-type transport system involved in cytochrome c biogenesis permease subunit
MEFIISFLNTLLPMLYVVTTFLYGFNFFRDEPFAEKSMGIILRITVFLHFIEVVLRWLCYDHFPLASIFEALSVLSLAAVLIYLYLEIRLKVQNTGFFILIFVLLMQLVSSAFISFTHDIPEILKSPLFALHTFAAILGYSGFTISFLYGLLYLLLFYHIKNSQFGVIYNRLPSLEVLSNLSFYSAVSGFVFLTIAIVVGFIWSYQLFQKILALDPKILVAYLTWFIYGLELFGGKFLHWSNKRLAYLSMSGFFIIVFSMIVVNLLFTSFHEFK